MKDRLEEPEMWQGVSENGDTICVDFSWFTVKFSLSEFVNGNPTIVAQEWRTPGTFEIDTSEDRYSWIGSRVREALKDHFDLYISVLEREISERSLELARLIANKDKLNLPVL